MNAKQDAMDAIWKGVGVLFGSMLNTAAKKGLAIMLLLGGIVGLILFLVHLDGRHGKEVAKLEDRILNIEAKLEMCNEERAKQAGKIAALETAIELLKGKKK